MRTLRSSLLLAALAPLTLAACADDLIPTQAAPADGALAAASPTGQQRRDETGPRPDSIFNRYIIRFRDDVGRPEEVSRTLVGQHGGVRKNVYEHVFKGFAVVNLPARAVDALRRNPNVALVEEDRRETANAVQTVGADGWALDRMDQPSLPLNQAYNFFFNGAGVHIYIVDSGIRGDHVEFAGRLGRGENEASWDWTSPYTDNFGHGTQAASAAGGATLGAARGATLHSVKITGDADVWSSDIVDGIDWVVGNTERPAVLNLSYKGATQSVADALQRALNAGIVVVKAAGNDNVDACGYSPANQVANVILVGGTNSNDWRRNTSNWGSCVDIFAPGGNVLLAGHGSSTETITNTGTSFAAPYVAGVAALMLQQRPTMGWADVNTALRASAFSGVLSGINAGSPNLLLNAQHHYAPITGPYSINSYTASTKTWSTSPLGGDGSWSFQWDVSVNGGAFTTVSNGSSYSRSIPAGSTFSMAVRLTATSAGRTLVNTKNVNVYSEAPEPVDECTNWKICP